MSIIAIAVSKILGEPPNQVLTDISLTIEDGEFVALTGRSGSGKSTLLYLLSTLDKATKGNIQIDGKEVARMPLSEIHAFRNRKVGFVFQFHYLLAELTAIENVLLPASKTHQVKEKNSYAKTLLELVGLQGKEKRLPRQLSGGEQQRVAIARSLIMKPKYIFADEPTGSLDSVSGNKVMKILQNTNQELGTTVVMVTHEPDYARLAKRQIHLADGKIVD